MVILNEKLKVEIVQRINNILVIDNNEWNNLDTRIKLKYIHHFCSCIDANKSSNNNSSNNNSSNNNSSNNNSIAIPLKSLKPKKIIQYFGICKTSNNKLFNIFNKQILDYTFEYRKKYINVNKRIYYSYRNLPIDEFNNIINEYNNIVYLFITKNKVNIKYFLTNITNSNIDKLVNYDNNYNYKITCELNTISIYISNSIIIKLVLDIANDAITNNIPVKYKVKLINNI